MTGYFITGTDTACGKTEISVGLMQYLQDRGQIVLGMKPIASGAVRTPRGLRNDDALRLQAQGSFTLNYSDVNPYAYEPPIAPHLAAKQVDDIIDLDLINANYQALALQADSIIVEGVGGWQVPLNEQQSIADLAGVLQLPVILVVGLKLGGINHALLSMESILASRTSLVGWVANVVNSDMQVKDENIAAIRARIEAPCLGVVPFMERPSATAVAGCLRLPEGLTLTPYQQNFKNQLEAAKKVTK